MFCSKVLVLIIRGFIYGGRKKKKKLNSGRSSLPKAYIVRNVLIYSGFIFYLHFYYLLYIQYYTNSSLNAYIQYSILSIYRHIDNKIAYTLNDQRTLLYIFDYNNFLSLQTRRKLTLTLTYLLISYILRQRIIRYRYRYRPNKVLILNSIYLVAIVVAIATKYKSLRRKKQAYGTGSIILGEVISIYGAILQTYTLTKNTIRSLTLVVAIYAYYDYYYYYVPLYYRSSLLLEQYGLVRRQ